MKDFIDSREYRLTCISPVHIGSGETFKAFEYLYDRKNKKVGFIQEEKWQKMLLRHNLLQDFLALLKNTKSGYANLLDWLRRHNVPEKEIWDTVKRTALNKSDVSDSKNTLNDICVASSLADGSLYIPGSSIKGALRTGILYSILQRKNLGEQLAGKISYIMENGNIKKELSNLATKEEKHLLTCRRPVEGKDDVLLKVLSGLVVGDAHLLKPANSVILQKVDVSTGTAKNGYHMSEHPISLFRECIPAGAEFSLRISLDKKLLSYCKLGSLQEILAYCREYLQQGLALQQQVFGAFYKGAFKEAQQADFSLGGGTGFLQKSIWYSLFSDERQAEWYLKQLLDCSFRKHDHRHQDRKISPRTLKLAVTGSQKQIMGLCRMEEI